MNEDEKQKLEELENARADHKSGNEDEEPPTSPQVGGPGLTGLTPPD